MEKAKEFLNNWINDVSNEQIEGEHLEYSEREVVEMLESYKSKAENLFISDVSDLSQSELVLTISPQFCEKCSPETWGQQIVQLQPDTQKCSGCGHVHKFSVGR